MQVALQAVGGESALDAAQLDALGVEYRGGHLGQVIIIGKRRVGVGVNLHHLNGAFLHLGQLFQRVAHGSAVAAPGGGEAEQQCAAGDFRHLAHVLSLVYAVELELAAALQAGGHLFIGADEGLDGFALRVGRRLGGGGELGGALLFFLVRFATAHAEQGEQQQTNQNTKAFHAAYLAIFPRSCQLFALVISRGCAIITRMKYTEKLAARIAATRSALCVGLDPRPQTENMTQLADWLRKVVEETAPYAAAYKPNIAYFEAMGLPGLKMLEELLPDMPKDIPVILDAKRGDIGETQKYYAQAYFDRMDVDAVTLNPFMGYDILEPFLDRPGKAVYLLAVTTNPGSVDVEQQVLANGRKVYQLVGDMVTRSIAENSATEVGMVVGLTNANSQILTDLPDAPLLVPGLGAQGGDLSALTGGTRVAPPTINVSRGILYKDPELSFAEKAEKWAALIREALAL